MERAISSPPTKDWRPAHVLIVCAEAAIRGELDVVLRALGTVHSVADADRLASTVRDPALELLVYDTRWPVSDASVAIGTLRAERATRELPILLLCSQSAGPLARVELADDPSTEVLLDPFSHAELLARARARIVTARRHAALVRSEAELRASFDASSLGIVHIDPFTGVILRVNRRYTELLGRSESDLLCTPYLQLVSPDDRDDAADTLRRIRESRDGLRTQRKVRRPDGSVVTIGATSDVVRDAEGRPLRIVSFLEDLTVRDRLETELRATEERYRDLVEHAGAALLVFDLEGRILEVNRTATETFGDVVGGALTTIAASADAARDALILGTHDTRRRLLELRRSDGSVFEAELTLHRDEGRIHGVVRDRSREEAARRTATFLVTVAEPVLVIDARGHIEFANSAAHRVFGYDDGELIGIDHALLVPERARAAHAHHVERFKDAPVARPMAQRAGAQLYGRRRDGTEFPIDVSLNPIATAAGPMVSTVVRDVTERQDLEQTAQAQSDRLRAAIDAIPDVFSIWDADDRLAVFNTAFARLWSELGIEITVGASRAALEHAAELRTPSQRALFTGIPSEGSSTTSDASEDVALDDGRVIRVNLRTMSNGSRVMIGFDLTQDLRREHELEEARRGAEAANRAKTEFLASMSHELRTPLNAVLGFAQLLRRDARTPLTPRHREMVERILRGGEQLLRLVDDVLDLARIEARGVVVNLEPVSVSELIGDVLETLAPLAREAGVVLRSVMPAEPVLTIQADRGRVTQILANLGSNAIKYNRVGGSVTLDADCEGDVVRVIVSDTGIGVPESERADLFRPFHRAGQETGPIPGTGIGLSISRRLAEMMGGTVGYRPRAGGGSEFWIEMPADRAVQGASSSPDAAPTRETPHRGLRVLYVDDNDASLELMRSALATHDVEVLVASSAKTGLALAQQHEPHVILMDLNVPGMDGFQALTQLRSTEATRSIPVIALSAAAAPADRERGLAAGFVAYLTKPVRLEDVEAAITAFARERA